MKIKLLFFTIWLVLLSDMASAQNGATFSSIMKGVKRDFKSDSTIDYGVIIQKLHKALRLQPNNAEAHYYLGYAYSRFNSSDATTIPNMKLPMVLKMSYEMETVNKLSPLYTGKLIVLDPYSKITSEWTCMAMQYNVNHKPDSAIWAFKEGKKRGGFNDFILSVNRAVLNSCSQNSILISSGDNYTLPLYYLQQVENLRPDVTIIDISMLGTPWYPELLLRTTTIKFDIKAPELDTLDYKTWSDTSISIPIDKTGKTFDWIVKPSYQQKYILRGDRIFLSMLRENKFKRDIYFTKGFTIEDQLSLDGRLLGHAIVDKLNVADENEPSTGEYIAEVKKVVSSLSPPYRNSPDSYLTIDEIRYEIMNRIEDAKSRGEKVKVNELLGLMNNYLSESRYSKFDDVLKKYFDGIKNN